MKTKWVDNDFLISALHSNNGINSIKSVLDWRSRVQKNQIANIEKIPISELNSGWSVKKSTGNLVHQSSKFFSIQGIRIRTNYGFTNQWDQPIIFQSEVGILGIICKKFDGILHFLLQAKTEPGNINLVQLSPTLQATKSNYTQVHKGSRPLFLEYFLNKNRGKTLLDQLQSEQCSRFYQKRNRNMIVQIDEEFEIPDNFCWLTLGQIKKLLQYDNIINMDTRSVVSCIEYIPYLDELSIYDSRSIFPFEIPNNSSLRSYFNSNSSRYSVEEIISWVAKIKSRYRLEVDRIPINEVNNWYLDQFNIRHTDNKYFTIMAVNVNIDNREISHWSQPMIKPMHRGVVGFLVKKINGIYHFLVQAKVEAGNSDIIELAPTVQCINDDYKNCPMEHIPPYLNYLLNLPKNQLLYSSLQSEEGGRFFQEQHQYMIAEVDDNFNEKIPRDYIWMTLSQMSLFIRFNNYFNIEARSLIAAIDFEK